MRLSRLVSVAVLALAAASPSQPPLHVFDGDSSMDRFGESVSGAGDVDGDGFADLVVGAPLDDNAGVDAGMVRVYSGRTGSALFSVDGTGVGDHLGWSVAAAGDVDGDGMADLVVGSRFDDDNGRDSGSACVLAGASGAIIHFFTGAAAGDQFGWSVAAAGDVDADGYADVIVGGPFADSSSTDAGVAHVYSGKTGALLHAFAGASANDQFGWSVAGVGDVDGDGMTDLAVGAPMEDGNGSDAGAAHVFSGGSGAALWGVSGDGAGDHLGWSVAAAGDVDGDLSPDLVVGAPHADSAAVDAGLAKVVAGSDGSIIHLVSGAASADHLGWSVGGGCDLDGDGYADIITGSPMHDGGGRDAGRAAIWSGATGQQLWVMHGSSSDGHLGWDVALSSDVNGDGYADAVLGLPGAGAGAARTGRAMVYGRAPYDQQAEQLFLQPASSPGAFGVDAQYVGDVNNDGVADYAIGAGQDAGLYGTVRVYSGADNSELHVFTGGAQNTQFGYSVGAAGDVDGDGYDDVLTGSQHWTSVFLQEGRATVWSGKTGAIIHQWSGVQATAHMGGALGGLGDIDNDGYGDVFIGSVKLNNNTGGVWAYSGKTGQRIYEVNGAQQGDWFGRHGATIGDINGDGVLDFAIGAPEVLVAPAAAPGYAAVLSGADGTQLWRFNGLFRDDKFGWVVAGPGDVDADGTPDILVGGHRFDPTGKIDAGMARVFSGATGQVLHHLEGEYSNDGFGQAVSGAGDVNGDGHADFLVGAPGADPGGMIGAGKAYLFSGSDGSLLQAFAGKNLLDGLGSSVLGLPDVSGDGFSDVVIGIPGDDSGGPQSGAAWVYHSQSHSEPGSFWSYGSACAGSNGKLPLISFGGRPVTGQSFDVKVSGGLPTTLAVLGFDSAQRQISLSAIGARSCVIWAIPSVTVPSGTGPSGSSKISVGVPAVPALVGAQLFTQWILADSYVTGLPLVFSNGGRVTVGR